MTARAEKIINTHIYSDQTELVELLLEKKLEGFDPDQIQNNITYNRNDLKIGWEKEQALLFKPTFYFSYRLSWAEYNLLSKSKGAQLLYDKNCDSPKLFWWAVSTELVQHLLKHEEIVLQNKYGQWWGILYDARKLEATKASHFRRHPILHKRIKNI